MKPEQAYRKVRTALKNGDLVRPDICERCGKSPPVGIDGRATIHAHHYDYDKPLDVEWLCARCHRKETPLPLVMGAPNYGSKNPISKLNEERVLQARNLRAAGMTYQSIANLLGVDKKTAMRAIKGELWRHIAAAPKPEDRYE